MILFCCALALAGVFSGVRTAVAHEGTTAEDVAGAVDNVERKDLLEKFVKDAAYHLQIASTLEQATQIFNDFRKEGYWKYKDTYLILLTGPATCTPIEKLSIDCTFLPPGGGVYVHPNRELEDQDWSRLVDGELNKVGKEFLKAGEDGHFVEYYGQDDQSPGVSYALSFAGLSSIPLTNLTAPERQRFVLVGGFNLEDGVEPTPISISQGRIKLGRIGFSINPTNQAKNVKEKEDRELLKLFVEEAIKFFGQALGNPKIDVIQLRELFRIEGGPWRDGSTYIYIMDGRGNVIFNGANRSIEQTNLWELKDNGDKFIQRIIAAAKTRNEHGGFVGDFVEYNWNDPADPNDDPPGGGAGGTSPKLAYAKAVTLTHNPLLKEDPDSPVYVFGSGIYLESEVEDGGGGCAIVAAGAEGAPESTVFNLFLVVSALFLAISSKRRSVGKHRKDRVSGQAGQGFLKDGKILAGSSQDNGKFFKGTHF